MNWAGSDLDEPSTRFVPIQYRPYSVSPPIQLRGYRPILLSRVPLSLCYSDCFARTQES